jgi:putative membrane protein
MLAIYLADRIISGFSAPSALYSLALIAVIFTALNLILKPIIKLILLPVAWLTFGLSSLAINMGMLFMLDILREDVIINGLVPLVLGTLFISVINLICQRLLLHKS